jgi:tRNA-specific 2-thiouridylase
MMEPGIRKERVVVAMSGGVDSSAAALMLKKQGYDVVGVSMQVWDYRNNNGNSKRATCCAPADFEDARDVSRLGDFPFYVFDFEDSFEEAVINPFVNAYLQGQTPNPCVECNRKVKFKELRKRAKALGASAVATGHYAQIKKLANGKLGLFTSKDKQKDQSYFLFALTQEELSQTIFPVGHLQKPDIRSYLSNEGVEAAQKAESQDICFVSSSVSEFIEKKTGIKPKSGAIKTTDGTVVGEHAGIHNFTVGQRKGLGGGSKNALYVLQIEPETNEIVVGAETDLQKKELIVHTVNWTSGEKPKEPFEALVKLRYRNAGVKCLITPLDQDRAQLKFIDKWTTVSPGQAAVFYSLESDAEGDFQVYGGGTISREKLADDFQSIATGNLNSNAEVQL